LDLAVLAQVEAESEVEVLRVITGRDVEAVAGAVVVGLADAPANAETPVRAAAIDRLIAVPAAAVGVIADKGAGMRLDAILVARRGRGYDIQERKAGAVVHAVRSLDDDD